MQKDKPGLYLVPTPIGNLEDITLRALRILKEVDVVLAEDTRTTGKLLQHFDIKADLKSYHIHNEHKTVSALLEQMKAGKCFALVSDAGTPGISDPGFLIARACLQEGIEIEVLPGANAFVPALLKSGFACDSFVFDGFLPHKKGKQTKIKSLLEETKTTIFYESPHRLMKTLEMMQEILGEERQVSVSRELTKLFEETITGSLSDVIAYYLEHPIKGEIVLIVEGNDSKKSKN